MHQIRTPATLPLSLVLLLMASLPSCVLAQTISENPPAPGLVSESAAVFPHTEKSRFYAAGQANIIFQANPPFHSPYEGANSFISRGEYKGLARRHPVHGCATPAKSAYGDRLHSGLRVRGWARP